jgi:uncharacterized protein (TIGR02271 family)
MITSQDAARLSGREVYGVDGDKIGTVGHVWSDPSGGAGWASVKTGMFGAKESMVPLGEADLRGDRLLVPFDKSQVRDAPRIDGSSSEPLGTDEVILLHDYYGMPATDQTAQGRRGRRGRRGAAATGGASTGAQGSAAAGYTADDVIDERAATDEAMTRSEERLIVGTERDQAGVAHLRKYVVTEQQEVTVPVSHEEIHVEREPITEENRAAATAGPDISEAEYDVPLFAEHAVVNKETVPVERIRLSKETVTEQQTVRGEVRKEHIEVDIPDEERRQLG